MRSVAQTTQPAAGALGSEPDLREVGRIAARVRTRVADGSTIEMIGAEHSPAFGSTTGSLAQALRYAGGGTLVRKLRGKTGHLRVFVSDGDHLEAPADTPTTDAG